MDPANAKTGQSIRNPDGYKYTVNWVYKAFEYLPVEDFSFSYDVKNNQTLNITATAKMPELAYSWFSENQFTNQSYVYIGVWAHRLKMGSEGNSVLTKAHAQTYDKSTKTLTAKISIPLKDYRDDSVMPYIDLALYLYNGSYRALYRTSFGENGLIPFPINFSDPTITTANHA